MPKKEQGSKRSKTLRDKIGRLPDWKRKQRANVKKYTEK